jgi:hypothetical protein
MKFTLVGYYTDNDQPWADVVDAEDWKGAIQEGSKLIEESLSVRICAVLEGDVKVADSLDETAEIVGIA